MTDTLTITKNKKLSALEHIKEQSRFLRGTHHRPRPA